MATPHWELVLARRLATLCFFLTAASTLFRQFYLHFPFDLMAIVLGTFTLSLGLMLLLRVRSIFLVLTMVGFMAVIGLLILENARQPRSSGFLVLLAAVVILVVYYRFWPAFGLLAVSTSIVLIMGWYYHVTNLGVVLPTQPALTIFRTWLSAGVGYCCVGLLMTSVVSYVVTNMAQSLLHTDNLLTAARYQKSRLEEKERLLTLFTELSSDYVFQINLEQPDMLPEIFAGSFERTTGYTIDELRRKGGWMNIVHPDDRERLQFLMPRIIEGEAMTNEYRIVSASGRTVWLRDNVRPLRDEKTGAISKLIGAVHDITERKLAEQQVENLAFYDPLTSLPNRRLLLDRLEQALALSTRSGQHGALLFIDLDHFKNLNDTKGHEAGDQLLVQQARRLNLCIREGDTVARLGGDEFIIILGELSSHAEAAAEEASEITHRILHALSRPVALTYRTMTDYENTCSIGLALFKGHEVSVDELLRRADMAMYQAKADGRNMFRFYDPQMQKLLAERLAMEEDLKSALAQQQFEIYLQPQVTSDKKLVGAEVLLRWHHPEQGMISPLQFIPVAERTGLIVEIGSWVLEQACLVQKRWAGRAETADVVLAVNVSARQFRQNDFVDRVEEILEKTGASGARIKLELTESLALENVEDTIEKMNRLRNLGVSISLDDFGTGQSSLSYLKRLPLNQLKIDQSFIRDIATDPNDAVLVQTIIGMAQNLNLDIIAEGVETADQLHFLVTHGCLVYQGFLFSSPVPVTDFESRYAA